MRASSELSPRERTVLALMFDGLSVKASAEALGLAPPTVKNAREKICQKFGVRGAVLACRRGIELGYLEVKREV